MTKPLAIDLYCGLGGWTEGLLAEGWDVIGFDIERHVYGDERFPGLLVLQDVRTLRGGQFRNVDLIVGSSPCQEFSYRAMPWKRARELGPPVLGIELFEAQFRIQREACEAACRHIPLVVENVRGAQKWVGRAAWNFGSYYLWGDVPALMPQPMDARKNPGFRFDGSGKSFQTESVERHVEGVKRPGQNLEHGGNRGDWNEGSGGSGMRPPARMSDRLPDDGRKSVGSGRAWFDQNIASLPSASPRRKAASAKIAKIPLALSRHIGWVFHPDRLRAAA